MLLNPSDRLGMTAETGFFLERDLFGQGEPHYPINTDYAIGPSRADGGYANGHLG